jgi:hypothetical protein
MGSNLGNGVIAVGGSSAIPVSFSADEAAVLGGSTMKEAIDIWLNTEYHGTAIIDKI